MATDDPDLDALLNEADVVLSTRGHGIDVNRAPAAVWVHLSPFGLTGPRAGWRAGDLGILAATGNLFATGDPVGSFRLVNSVPTTTGVVIVTYQRSAHTMA